MILPQLQGSLDQSNFFIYVAADHVYFQTYGRALINSVLRNTAYGVHVHIYDPKPADIGFCSRDRVSLSWERTTPGQFDTAIQLWSRDDLSEPYAARKQKMLGLKQFQQNENLALWIRKTYYACMRFVRLAELVHEPRRFLEIDIDGIVRAPFADRFADDADRDVYLYEKHKVDKATRQRTFTGHLAGSILFTDKPAAVDFLQQLAQVMRREIEADNTYWFLDQNVLDQVIQGYRKGILPQSYIDWRMTPDSAIWTAKGRRKDLEIFQRELQRYQ